MHIAVLVTFEQFGSGRKKLTASPSHGATSALLHQSDCFFEICQSIQLNLEGHPGYGAEMGRMGLVRLFGGFVGVVDFRVPGEITNMEPENQQNHLPKLHGCLGSIKTGCNG